MLPSIKESKIAKNGNASVIFYEKTKVAWVFYLTNQ
jgi:hypothetical protein